MQQLKQRLVYKQEQRKFFLSSAIIIGARTEQDHHDTMVGDMTFA